ncbi:MAG: 16S rRNA (guanine(527)-N(7))-methyltransferase RsmG [Cellvibrionaceae bacterium]
MTDELVRQRLITGLDELELSFSEAQIFQLLAYLQLFVKWNKAYNLSAVRSVDEMVSRHLLDSLSIAPFLQRTNSNSNNSSQTKGRRWLDVGSGGGLPGIPLAIAFPDNELTLLDSNGKKTRFLFQVKTELQLALSVVQSRVEDFRPEKGFDGIFSRAFTSVQGFLTSCQHLVTPGTRFYAMKGQYPQDELREVAKPFNVEHCYPVRVPGEAVARHLVVVSHA